LRVGDVLEIVIFKGMSLKLGILCWAPF